MECIRKALAASRVSGADIQGIGVDGTSCTVVFLDERGEPLRDAVMWMDIRAVKEAAEVAATGDPALRYAGARQRVRGVVPLQDRVGQDATSRRCTRMPSPCSRRPTGLPSA